MSQAAARQATANAAPATGGAGDMGFGAAARVYARMTLMRLRRGRALWAALLLLLSPLLYVVPLVIAGHWGRGLFDEVNELYFRFLVQFVPALLAAPLLAEEIENKTFTFVFARPAPRTALIMGKYIAAIGPLVVVTVPAIAICWLIALARFPADMADGWQHLLRVELAAVLGLCAFGALELTLGTIFSRHPFVAIVFYLGVLEAGLGSTPVVANQLAISWHLRNLAELPLPAAEYVAFHTPAWGSALVALVATPLFLWLSSLSVNGAEYRTDR